MKTTYQPFADASLAAAARGDKEFTLDLGYGPFTARAIKRLDKSRLHVQDELQHCDLAGSLLSDIGVLGFYQHPPYIGV